MYYINLFTFSSFLLGLSCCRSYSKMPFWLLFSLSGILLILYKVGMGTLAHKLVVSVCKIKFFSLMLYYFYVNSVIYFVQTFAQKLLDLSQEL